MDATWFMLGFIAVHFLFRWLLVRTGVNEEPLASRLRRARLHPWRGPALLLVIAVGLVLQLAQAPVWVAVATIFPAFAVIWLVSEVRVVRWLRDDDAPRPLRIVHAVRLFVYLTAILGLVALNHLATSSSGTPRWFWVAGGGAVIAVAGAVVAVAWREARGLDALVRGVVDEAVDDMKHASKEASILAHRVEKLAETGELDKAHALAAPLIADAGGERPGWGVAGEACRAAQALVVAHARDGDRDGAAAALDTLERLATRPGLDPLGGLTAIFGMGKVVDALLAAGSRPDAVRALDVMAALHRSAPGTDFLHGEPVARVIAALLEAGDVDTARDVFRRHVATAVPPIPLDATLVARLEAP